MLITGPSGSGKSHLLRQLTKHHRGRLLDLQTIKFPDRPVIDCLKDRSIMEALRALAAVGLGEAWSYLRTPSELSEGQRWRLRLAIALDRIEQTRRAREADLPTNNPESASTPVPNRTSVRQSPVLICDEFAAVLDRITAYIVARLVRKMVTAHPTFGVVIATSHDDLFDALQPEIHVRCDFESFEIIRSTIENPHPAQEGAD